MDKVLGMGNALVDVMTKIDTDELLNNLNLPKGSMQLVNTDISDKILEQTKKFDSILTSGGSAANTIHGIAQLGIDTGFIGKIGNDELGNFFKKDLEQSNITPILLNSATASGKAIALVSPDSERTFATFLGAAVELSAADLKPEMFIGYKYFHIEGYLVQNHELIETAVKIAKEAGLLVSLDLAAYNVVESNLEFLKNIISNYVDIVFANEEEAKAFTGKEPKEALNEIAEICKIAVVKIGKNGSLVKTNGEVTVIGVSDASKIDTTGAGDLYAAGFIYGLVNNASIAKCGKYGSLLSGKVIEVLGAKISSDEWNYIKNQIN